MWLPASTRAELARDERAITEMTLIDEAVRHFTRELKSIDVDLELVKASNNATLPGLVPGYWHILRKGTPCTLITLEGPNGEYREPGSWMFPWLAEQDAWNDRTQQMKKELREKAERAKSREKERERQDRAGQLNELLKWQNNASVSMTNRGKGWTYGAGMPQPKKQP